MYRDFLYLDIDRVQSIIAQLEKGLLEQVLEGKKSALDGKASITAGVLATFLPMGVEGDIHRQHEVQATKVLHDYAFNVAIEALERENLSLEIQEDWERDNLLLPDGTFILGQGSLSIIDYGLLKELGKNEGVLSALFKNKPGSNVKKSGVSKTQISPQRMDQSLKNFIAFIDGFMGDVIHVRLSCSNSIILIGPVNREYLRERIRDLIFKYGGKPREGWKMLAQINQVTMPFNKLASLSEMSSNIPNFSEMDIQTLSDILNPIIQVLNVFQEAIASVSYPAISVTPIALYRELENVN